MYCSDSRVFVLAYYYMYGKVHEMIARERINLEISRVGSPFYRTIYKVLREIHSMDNVQLCKSKLIYKELMKPKAIPTTEEKIFIYL